MPLNDNNKKELKTIRRELRRNLTPAEATLWKYLKSRQLCGMLWRRQFSVGKYVLDFYCHEKRLCIELDGQMHFTVGGDRSDLERTEYLNSKGIRVIRFENCDIWHNIDAVIDEIKRCAVQDI